MTIYKSGTKFNDVLDEQTIKSWDGNNVILNGATGSGKTYFIFNNLYEFAKINGRNILFLCNRKELFLEVIREKERLQLYNIDVMLYQTLQEMLNREDFIQQYNYIVCDEFHYVLSDAVFNKYTDLTYEWIINRDDSIKIFMSGTGDRIFQKLTSSKIVNKDFEYVIPYDYSYVKQLSFFENREKVFDIVNNILNETEEKIIFFSNSIEFAIEVYNQFKNYSYFRCSQYTLNPIARKLNNLCKDCIVNYNDDLITFDKRILITTKALDNGINIKDRKIKHIICDIFDLESLQQCLGRKRIIDNEDVCNFYIRNYSKKDVGRFKGFLNSDIKPIQTLKRDKDEYMACYGKNREQHSDYIFYNGEELVYNRLAYWKMLCQSVDIDNIQRNGYKKVILDILGDTITEIIDLDNLEKMNRKNTLIMYIEGILDRRLYREQQKELINNINLTVRSKKYQALSKLNLAFEILGLNYQIQSKRIRESGSLKTVWIVNKIE
ncbi:DEAD/DEAH box helicase family protein [Clostridium butyricum]|nr:DEAD/DEAH box helicase family protein [Clostridium butyricum]